MNDRYLNPPSIAVYPLPPAQWALDVVQAAGAKAAGLEEADALIWTSLGGQGLADAVEKATRARWVQLASAGVEWVFEEAVYDPSKIWTCAKGVYGDRVVELALGMLIGAFRHLPTYARLSSWLPEQGHSLAGTNIGVVGGGGIGSRLAEVLGLLGASTTVFTRSGATVRGATRSTQIDNLLDVAAVLDALVLAAPLTPATRNLVNAELLDVLPQRCWIVNVARGQLVDTDALVAALTRGQIAGAALDVTDPEPLPPGHSLWGLPNCLITPHVANFVAGDANPLAERIAENVARFVRGAELIGVIDGKGQY